MHTTHPTPYPEVNALLQELLESVQTILGRHFIGMYLEGSLTSDDFDQDSDIDFVVVTDNEISGDLFFALQSLHDRIATIDSPWAIQLEGSYISQRALRRYNRAYALHPNIERGTGERLKMLHHDEAWVIHCYILRERGMTLAGPAPQTLIDPVSPTDLRQALLSMLPGQAARILHENAQLNRAGYQSYIVLTLCRILYTLHYGTVISKRAAARWAQQALDQRWVPLIERAWAARRNPGLEASSEDVNGTLEFMRYTLERSKV
jgi:Domain of unknown function (DUF4111)/Nucleotidyltransferase domain